MNNILASNFKKMKSFPILVVLFLFSGSAFSQYDFLFEPTDLQTIRVYEDSIKSKSLGYFKTKVGKDYFPTAKENHTYYPLAFIRINDAFFPELHVKYYYSEKDSSLLATSYNWNIMDYVDNIKTDGDKFETEKKRKKEYLKKYNSIKSELIAKYGKPTSIEENSDAAGYIYRLEWENEKNDILVLMQFSKKLKHIGNMKIGSFSIRVKIDYN